MSLPAKRLEDIGALSYPCITLSLHCKPNISLNSVADTQYCCRDCRTACCVLLRWNKRCRSMTHACPHVTNSVLCVCVLSQLITSYQNNQTVSTISCCSACVYQEQGHEPGFEAQIWSQSWCCSCTMTNCGHDAGSIRSIGRLQITEMWTQQGMK